MSSDSFGATDRDRAEGLIFDWNEVNRKGRILPKNATFFDETLRDGLQNPSVKDPSIVNANGPVANRTPAWDRAWELEVP